MADNFVNLKVDRSLLDPHFDGYKLSLDKIPIYQHALESDVTVHKLRDEQYSYQHMKAFGMQNHLFADPYDSHAVYIVDQRRKVVKHHFKEDSTTPCSSSVLALPPVSPSRTCQDVLNATLCFAGEEWLVLADGHGSLHLVHTQNRAQDLNWETVFSASLDNDGIPFTVVSSTFHLVEATPNIEAVFLTVTKNDEEDKPAPEATDDSEDKNNQKQPVTKSAFITTLHWLTLSQDEGEWKLTRTRKLSSAASPDFVSMEGDGSAIVVASDKPVKFTYDSEKPVQVEKKKEDWIMVDQAAASSDPPPLYTWSQTMPDVSVTFTLPLNTTKGDVVYKLSHDHLELCVKNGPRLLVGQLHAGVDPECSTWTMETGTRRLTVELSKREEALWPTVVLGDTRGEMTLDPKLVEGIHERLAHLTSEQWNPDPNSDSDQAPAYNAQQLEDCDIFPDDNSQLQRLDGDSHEATHLVNLGGHQWLFNVSLASSPCLCLRHDVDGLLWQPVSRPAHAGSPLEHVGTFNALGYVAASKRERRFAVCAPDMSYAALVDCVRHVYVYRQPTPTLTPLRNRKTGRTVGAVAKQQLVSLETVDPILGVHAGNEHMFILTKNSLYLLKTKEAKE